MRQTTIHGKKARDLNHLVRVQNLAGHTQGVRVLRPSAKGDLLASAGDDCSVRVWQLMGHDGRWTPSPAPSVSTPSSAATGPAEATTAWAEDTFILPIYSPTPRHVFLGHTKPITDLAWSEVRERLKQRD